MFYTYIIYSESIDKYYIGYTHDLALRLERHNNGWGKYSSKGIPWKLVYQKYLVPCLMQLKEKMKSRKYIESLITKA